MFSRSSMFKWMKWLLGLAILLYLFFVLRDHLKQDLSWSDFPSISALNWWALIFVFFLMPLNWALEALKWLRMMRRNGENWSFRQAFNCVMAGTSTAIFTPNRLGDVAGRMVLVSGENREDAFWATVLCNSSQLSALLVLGIPGLFFFIQLVPDSGLEFSSTAVFLASAGLTMIVLLFFYRASVIIPVIIDLLPLKTWREYLQKTLAVLSNASLSDLNVLLLLSMLRTLTYAFQYFLTILFFGVKLGLAETVASILAVYLLKTVVPYLPAMGILVRAELSLWVFSAFTDELTLILAASFLIWVINVVLPAIWGYFLILTTNIKGKS